VIGPETPEPGAGDPVSSRRPPPPPAKSGPPGPTFTELFLEPDEPLVGSASGSGRSESDTGPRTVTERNHAEPEPEAEVGAESDPPPPEPDAGVTQAEGLLLPQPDGMFHGPDGLFHGSDALFIEPEPTPDPEGPSGQNQNLRDSALQGGAYLAVRELVGMAIRVVGVVVVTRVVGPREFGIYSGAAAFAAVVITIAQMGMEVYLIRQPEEPSIRLYNEVFSFVAALSAASVVLSLGFSLILENLHPSSAPAIRVFRVLLISVPLNALWAPAQARIERAFGFRKMAMLELGGDVMLYAVAVPLAVAGWGAYSLVVGVIAWQAFLLVGSYRMARMFPRLCLPSSRWLDFLRHGLAYSASSWVTSILGLANPIVVGRYFGAIGVGYVALAARLVDTIGFAQRATWRLGLVALSKVQDNEDRARRGVEEGMVLQVLMVAVPMAGVAVFGKLLIPLIFGNQWLPALNVFALLGAAAILNAPLTVQMALLFSRAKNQAVVIACILNAAIVFGAAFIFVPWVGIEGYGIAAIIGTVGSLVIYVQARKIQYFSSTRPLPWIIAFIPPMLFPLVQWPENLLLLLPLLLLVVVRDMREQMIEYTKMVLQRVRRL
jgi:O-antigen/teichoic acid export membrane protein